MGRFVIAEIQAFSAGTTLEQFRADDVGLVASIVVGVAAEAWSWQARLVLALVVGVPYLIDDCPSRQCESRRPPGV